MSSSTKSPLVLRLSKLATVIIGVLFVLVGTGAWVGISGQLAAENITVPADAPFMAGHTVRGPVTAIAQAQTIAKHVDGMTNGRNITQLKADKAAAEAQYGQDSVQAQEVAGLHDTAEHAALLRSSLFTSVLAFGVSLLAIGVGVVVLLISFNTRQQKKVAVADKD